MGVTMNKSNPGYHVTEIDRNNRTVKEIIRAQYHRLPFQDIPKVMIIYLAFEVVRKLNDFPVKEFLLPYYINQTIVYQQPLEYNKDFTITFGEFIPEKITTISNIQNFHGQLTTFTNMGMGYFIYKVT